jgi:hypothetical protein
VNSEQVLPAYMDPLLVSLLNSQAFAAFIGAAAAIAASFVTGEIERHRTTKADLERKLATLKSIINEISFYLGKFRQLRSELEETYRRIQRHRQPIIPSYDFYPAYLEKCRIDLGTSKGFEDFAVQTGNCLFEL